MLNTNPIDNSFIEPPKTELKTIYIDKMPVEIRQLINDPLKCEQEGFDWHLEYHKFKELLNEANK